MIEVFPRLAASRRRRRSGLFAEPTPSEAADILVMTACGARFQCAWIDQIQTPNLSGISILARENVPNDFFSRGNPNLNVMLFILSAISVAAIMISLRLPETGSKASRPALSRSSRLTFVFKSNIQPSVISEYEDRHHHHRRTRQFQWPLSQPHRNHVPHFR